MLNMYALDGLNAHSLVTIKLRVCVMLPLSSAVHIFYPYTYTYVYLNIMISIKACMHIHTFCLHVCSAWYVNACVLATARYIQRI